MRTSLSEIERIENYVSGNLSLEERKTLDAQYKLDHQWRFEVNIQRLVYRLINVFGRKELISEVAKKVFSDPTHRLFQEKINKIFKEK